MPGRRSTTRRAPRRAPQVDAEGLPVEKGAAPPPPGALATQSECCKAELYPVYIGLAATAFKCANCGRMQDPKKIGLPT